MYITIMSKAPCAVAPGMSQKKVRNQFRLYNPQNRGATLTVREYTPDTDRVVTDLGTYRLEDILCDEVPEISHHTVGGEVTLSCQ